MTAVRALREVSIPRPIVALVASAMLLTGAVAADAATTVTLTSDRPSPQLAGTGIVWTASATGGVAPYEYKFWVQFNGVWRTFRTWTSSPTVTWAPSAPGPYLFAVWARSTGNTMDAAEALAQTSFTIVLANPVTAVSLTSDRSSPQMLGTHITWTAAAAGGTAPYEYKFWVQFNGAWNTVRTWTSSPTMTWAPSANGTYVIAVWARSQGNAADAAEAMNQASFTIRVPNPVSGVTLVSDRASPQLPGRRITWTAAATGGVAPYEYRFWMQFNGGAWTTLRTWTASPSVAWEPSAQGTYSVAVWARSQGNAADAPEAMAQTTFAIAVANPVGSVSLTSSASSPQQVGTPVVWTASATGGIAPYEYKFLVQYNGGTWDTLRQWNTSATVAWTPTAPGTYGVAVWARSSGSIGETPEAVDQETFSLYVCSYTLTPPHILADSNGDDGTVAVTVEPSHCPYAPTSDVAWLNVNDSTTRSGASTLTWTVSPNTSEHDRNAVIRIGNQSVQIDQCFYTVSEPGGAIGVGGGSGTLSLRASSPACLWSARSDRAWLTLTGTTSGAGDATLSYTVAPNPGQSSRSAVVNAAGRPVTLFQRGNQPACEYSIDPDSITVPAEGVTQTAWVRAPSGCRWSAFTESNFVRVTSGASGSGDGDFTYTVGNNYSGGGDSNPHAERYADIRVADRVLRITQTNYTPPDNPCAAAQVTPAQNSVGNGATTGVLHVSVPPSCSWIAASESTFIHVISGSGGTGSGTVVYSVDENASEEPRTGSLLVAGKIVRVSQSGISGSGCTYDVTPTNIAVGSAQQTGTLEISAAPACEWVAESQSDFIAITSGGVGGGTGSVYYSVATNTAASGRSGVLAVAGRTVTVFQAGATESDVTASVDLRIAADDGNPDVLWEPMDDEPGEGDLTFLLECRGEYFAAGAAPFALAIIIDGKIKAGPQTFTGRGALQLRARASLGDRIAVCQVITLEHRITRTDTVILPGAGPNVASVKIAAFVPGEYVGNPATLGITIFEGDRPQFAFANATSRQQTIYEVLNPAVNNADVVGEHHNVGMSVEYDRDTSTSPPPFGPLTQAARDDWDEGYPMKLRWATAQLNVDGNTLMCTRPHREGADSTAGTSTHRFRCVGSVEIPLVSAAPHIDWDLTFRMVYGNNQVSVTVTGCHDGFPAYEAYVNGQTLFTRDTDGNIEHLFPPCERELSMTKVIR